MNKQPDSLAKNKINVSTQQYLDIAEIKNDTVIMRDGTMRAVLLVSSINFALKSEDEQNALISGYVSFLNNLDFPLQIVIQSRELDMSGYLKRMRQKEKEQTNDLLKLQISEHIRYLEELVSIGNIMTKRFLVIVPYNPIGDVKRNFTTSLVDIFRPVTLLRLKEEVFNERKSRLEKRVGQVASGLSSFGVQSTQIDTQGLIELYYSAYNPDVSEREKMTNEISQNYV